MRTILPLIVFNIFVNNCIAFPADEIVKLPGLVTNNTKFRQYSGYLDISANRHYHYWFVESQSKPRTDPVVLWLNGGPGCSSIDGFWSENGPFRIKDQNFTLSANPFSWNTVANVLYLESPVGVGFSYDTNKNFTNNDDSTADDNYLALQKFFEKFPELRKNAFYITGESYAGIYIPMLAINIFKNNEKKPKINLKGVAIGNGALDQSLMDGFEMAYGHGLASLAHYEKMMDLCCECKKKCSFEYSVIKNKTNGCYAAYNNFTQEMMKTILVYAYNIYSDCDVPMLFAKSGRVSRAIQRKFGTDFDFDEISPEFDVFSSKTECVSNAYVKYMNLPEVRKATHIPDHLGKWSVCGSAHYKGQYPSMKSRVKELVEIHKIPTFIVYNGDIDMVCDFMADQHFVDGLGYKLNDKYQKWTAGGRTAGFIKRYEGITFMTVRNAGHMVPSDQPEAALTLLKELVGISKVA